MSDSILTAPCPNCGQIVNSTMNACPQCGYEINRDIDVRDETE